MSLSYIYFNPFSPKLDTYERVCTELGFPKIEIVKMLSQANMAITQLEPIGIHNPLCGAGFILGCESNPIYKQCTHKEDVYIKCAGHRAEVPQALSKYITLIR